jgi:hypothetical protein
LPFVLASILLFLTALPFFVFPRYLPGTAAVRQHKRDLTKALVAQREEREGKHGKYGKSGDNDSGNGGDGGGVGGGGDGKVGRWQSIKYLLGSLAANKTYVMLCLGSAAESFPVGGLAIFVSRASVQSFRLFVLPLLCCSAS